MFDGVPEQFHQLIAPRTTLPLHLSFPPPFDAYNPSHHHFPLPPQPPPPNLLHPLHLKDEQHKQEENNINLEINERETQLGEDELELIDSWTNDEVLALLKIRSSMDTWFPDLTWEHVSRKLAELGFKRSAEKCKEKFEEETRYFNNNNNTIHYTKNNNNYRFISDLEQLYQQAHPNPIPEVEVGPQKSKHLPEKPTHQDQEQHKMGQALEEDDSVSTKQCEKSEKKSKKYRKRKRRNKFEMLKGFCENMVNRMMAQQEQMHNKLLEDMFKRDQENYAIEEAWKKQEIDRMNRELEMMAKEQAIAGDRQAAMIELLKKFSDQSFESGGIGKLNLKSVSNGSNPNSLASSPLNSQNPNPSSHYVGENNPEPPDAAENPSSSEIPSSSNPNSVITQYNIPVATKSASPTEKDDAGRRWPKEEVVALINLRCGVNNNSVSNNEEKDGGCRAPLWERISQGMRELGYKRSAKRCKEKWENINKYFRKTKDVRKKRSLDSRTCPYFHQLTSLYTQGKLINDNNNAQTQSHDHHHHHPPDIQPHSQFDGSAENEKTVMQMQLSPPPPALDFHNL